MESRGWKIELGWKVRLGVVRHLDLSLACGNPFKIISSKYVKRDLKKTHVRERHSEEGGKGNYFQV